MIKTKGLFLVFPVSILLLAASFFLLVQDRPHSSSQTLETFQSAILITIDTLRGDHLGFMGNPSIRSPALDRLSQKSTVFTESYTNTPITLPAHSAMMTSRFPRDLGLEMNDQLLLPKDTTLTEILKRNGFITAAYPQAILQFRRGLDRGFDFYDAKENRITQEQKQKLSWYHPNTDIDSQNAVPRAITWLSERNQLKERYYLWMHFFEPHIPYNPPEPFRYVDQDSDNMIIDKAIADFSKHNAQMRSTFTDQDIHIARTEYRNEIFWVDTKLESLFRTLITMNQPKPFILVTADHGEVLHDRQPGFFHGFTLSREELHTPFLVYSNEQQKGIDSSTLVQSVDVAPTILAALDIPGLPEFRGANVMSIGSQVNRPMPLSIGSPPKYVGAMNMRYKVVMDTKQETWKYWDRDTDYAEKRPVSITKAAPEEVTNLKTLATHYLEDNANHKPVNYWDESDSEFFQLLESLGYIQ
ncbi:MAG: sulfatase [bacterium]